MLQVNILILTVEGRQKYLLLLLCSRAAKPIRECMASGEEAAAASHAGVQSQIMN